MRRKPRIDIYKDVVGEWRFRIRSKNGKVICVSSESYKRRRGAVRAVYITREMLVLW